MKTFCFSRPSCMDPPLFSATDTSVIDSLAYHSSLSSSSEIERAIICDVYVGYCDRQQPLLMRFVKWLQAEMAIHGFSCFFSNRSDDRANAKSRTAMEEAALGLLIITRKSFSNSWSINELNFLLLRKKLVPIFFGLMKGQCLYRNIVEKKGEIWSKYGGELWKKYKGVEGEWKKAVDGLSKLDLMLEVGIHNMRDCVLDAILLIGKKLGRRDSVEKLVKWKKNMAEGKEFLFARNPNFTGRKNEFFELKLMLFGDGEIEEDTAFFNLIAQRERGFNDLTLGKGIACVSAESGTGKTELLLEFAYRYSQMYKMVLWINGEAMYTRINYMNLLPLLGIDVSIDNLRPDGTYSVNFEETETEAIQKVRKEFTRGIPYLLLIDNLESEKDWWDGRNIMELFPCFGGETHIIISTRLPTVMNLTPLHLCNLSSAEGMSLMTKSLMDVKDVEFNALKAMEDGLGRLSFGLGVIGSILSDYSIDPPKLLEAINGMPHRAMECHGKEGALFRHNPFLIQLLDFVFLVLIPKKKKHGNSALRMAQVSGCFAPSPVPLSLLYLTTEISKERASSCFCKNYFQKLRGRRRTTSHTNLLKAKAASDQLITLNLARCSASNSYIFFHNITKMYANLNGNDLDASSMVRAVSIQGSLPEHINHIWAACFLLFKFTPSPTVVNLDVRDLLSFIRKFVMPLANHSFATLSRCDPILDLLRHSTEALESVENHILACATVEEAIPFCFCRSSILDVSPLIYQDLAHLRATILETRAKFMLLCGRYEIGEQLCRRALNIKEVIYGCEHFETMSTLETMERLLSLQANC